MPADSTATAGSSPQAIAGRHPLAARRILRLSLGTSLCLLFSQVINWPLSFIAPVLTLMILGLPLPPLGIKKGMGFIIAMLLPMVAGMLLLPFLEHARWAGIALVGLALFFSFYYTARGGSAVMGTFMTVGLTLVVTIGSVNSQLMVVLVQAMAVCAVVGMAFVWLAHLLLPDPPRDPAMPRMKPPPPPVNPPEEVLRRSVRSMFVVFPLALTFMFMSGSPTYTVVMIKSASLGQQATSDKSREMGRSLLESTFWGGVGAIIGWYALSIWPSLVFYTLIIALAGLYFGRGDFQRAGGGAKIPDVVVCLPDHGRDPGSGCARQPRQQQCGVGILAATGPDRAGCDLRHHHSCGVRCVLERETGIDNTRSGSGTES